MVLPPIAVVLAAPAAAVAAVAAGCAGSSSGIGSAAVAELRLKALLRRARASFSLRDYEQALQVWWPLLITDGLFGGGAATRGVCVGTAGPADRAWSCF